MVIVLTAASAFAQGSLTPPGAPAPTMKTLQQVEPRTPISSVPYTISQPGSYYLSSNLTGGTGDGITIAADNVTLDLMGFTVAGGSGSGILGQSGHEGLVIQNGQLRGWGTDGIHLNGIGAALKNLRSTDNGVDGFHIGANALVSDCVAAGNGDDGFSSETGGSNRLERCRSQGNAYGFYFPSGANQLKECEALGCTFTGMWIGGGCSVLDNTVIGNGAAGLYLYGTGSYIANNIVKGNADNYALADGNQLNILLCEIPETLDWPCSVKLAGSLTCTQTEVVGITVAANDVTIDMDGHTLIGPGASSSSGIYQDSAYRNLTVKNGKVIHWEGSGVAGICAKGKSVILSGLQASVNFYGICTEDGGTIHDCVASDNTNNGIMVSSGSQVTGCTCDSNGHIGDGAGIYASSSDNRIDGNTVIDNVRGIEVDSVGNFIVRNTARGNTIANYGIVAGNDTGTIQTTPVGAGAWDNFSF